MEQWIEAMEAGGLAPKTINNTLGTLVVCLNAAVEDRLIATNPALRVDRLPPAHIEREYLRLHEIPLYLDSCSEVYRPARGAADRERPAHLRGAGVACGRPGA